MVVFIRHTLALSTSRLVIMSKHLLDQQVEDADQMHELGLRISKQLRAGDLVVLVGPLGAGKTTLARGIGEGLRAIGNVS